MLALDLKVPPDVVALGVIGFGSHETRCTSARC